MNMDYKYYINQNRYDSILERLKLKTTTHKTRYKFHLYLIDENYFFGLDINMWDDKIVQINMLIDLKYDDKGIYVDYITAAHSKCKRRLIVIK